MLLQGMARRQDPGCSLPRPLFRDVVVGKKSRPISAYCAKSIPQGESSFPILQPTVCAGIHDEAFANYDQR